LESGFQVGVWDLAPIVSTPGLAYRSLKAVTLKTNRPSFKWTHWHEFPTEDNVRQFWLMNSNSRCSILFHLLVPGGKWQTENLFVKNIRQVMSAPAA